MKQTERVWKIFYLAFAMVTQRERPYSSSQVREPFSGAHYRERNGLSLLKTNDTLGGPTWKIIPREAGIENRVPLQIGIPDLACWSYTIKGKSMCLVGCLNARGFPLRSIKTNKLLCIFFAHFLQNRKFSDDTGSPSGGNRWRRHRPD